MADKKLISQLERLLEVSRISRKGYSDAASQVKDPVLQTRFNQFAQQRNLYIEYFSSQVSQLGGSPKEADSFEGNMMRMWIDFKSGLIGHDEEKIIDQCLKEEKNTLVEFENALKEDLPAEIRQKVNAMDEEVRKSYQQLQELKKHHD